MGNGGSFGIAANAMMGLTVLETSQLAAAVVTFNAETAKKSC
jgi:hypothetical protein